MKFFRRLNHALFLASLKAVYALSNNPTQALWSCVPASSPEQGWSCHLLKVPTAKQDLATALGWIPDTTDTAPHPELPKSCGTCGGHYYLPPLPHPEEAGKSIDEVPSDISADRANYRLNGQGELTGNVVLLQPGRLLKSDSATLYQQSSPKDKKQKISRVEAQGNLSIQQPDTLVLADRLNADLFSHKAEIFNVNYLMQLKPGFNGTLDHDENFTGFAHGSAEKAYQRSQSLYDFYHATYATCPPNEKTWVLHASHIQLNRENSRGYATNVWLTAHGLPFFYTPYLSFPLSKERQTGFLYGSIGYSGDAGNGVSLTAPYYLNLAPNYDDTITPTLYQQRGLLLSNETRFLSKDAQATLNLQYIRDQFSHENRGSVYYGQHAQLSSRWSLDANFNYLSDKDFLSDFSNIYDLSGLGAATPGAGLAAASNVTVLPRDLELNYADPHWQWTNSVVSYQIIDTDLNLDNRPYNLLPQSTLTGSVLTQTSLPVKVSFLGQFTNFQKRVADSETAITGQRLLVNPRFEVPFTRSYGFVTPGVTVNNSLYWLQNQGINSTYPNREKNETIPQWNLRTGLYFDRSFDLFGQGYTQTLEPELMYLYTPNVDQSQIPTFDTTPISFNYDQLFALNRFSGYDRIGDTNQLTYAFKTNIKNSFGNSIFSAGVGQIYYVDSRRTTLCNPSESCIAQENPNYQSHVSPVAMKAMWALTPEWNMNVSEAYNFQTHSWSYQNYGVQYLPDSKHVLNFNYINNAQNYYLLSREQILDGVSPPRSSQVVLSGIWKFTPVWHALGDWDYSIDHQKTVSEFAAIEYNACCYAIQLGVYRYLLTDNPNNPSELSNHYRTSIVGQILLKGLGGIGDSNFEKLAQQIPGYSRSD